LPSVIEAVEAATAELRRLQEAQGKGGTPQLSFARALIPKEPHRVDLGDLKYPYNRAGRVIQVPIINAQGAGPARAAHGVLNFLPDDSQGSVSPAHPLQGEWVADDGSLVTTVDLPGNGQVRYLNVALVMNAGYPCIFGWTRASREAGLSGFEVWSERAEIAVEVLSDGSTEPLRDTLVIERSSGLVKADWTNRHPDEASNWVALRGRGWAWN